jgi:large subunit ribosomal protein L25
VLMAMRTPNVLIRLEGLPGGAQLALPKAIQRDPIKGWVEHLDLLVVRRGEKVTVDIPVVVTGEIAPGGMLDQQLVQVSVKAEATHIPTGINVNIEGMEVGATVNAGDLTLPSGVELEDEPDLMVLHVISAPTAEELGAEVAEEVEEAAEEAGGPAAAESSAASESGEEPAAG